MPTREPAGGNYAQTAADHCKPDIISPAKTDAERQPETSYLAKAKKNYASGEVAIKQFLEKADAPDSAALFTEAIHLAIAGLQNTK